MPALFLLRRPRLALILLLSGLLGACSTASNTAVEQISRLISPYKAEIVQGNVITSEQLALIQPGKTRSEVRDALGSPLLTDAFHAQRWDYAFTLRRNGVEQQRRSVVILFDGDVVKQIEAPELPSERDFVSSIKPPARNSDEPLPKLSLTIIERALLPAPPPPAPRASAPQGADRPYPPLESL